MSHLTLHSHYCSLEKFPTDPLNEILSNLNEKQIQLTSIATKTLRTSIVQAVITKEDPALLKFVNFLKKNLKEKLNQDQLYSLSIIVDGTIIRDSNLFNLNRVKFSITLVQSQIIEVLKTLELKDLEDLKNSCGQEEKPFFFNNIFELVPIYKQIDERLSREEKINQLLGNAIDGKLFLSHFKELFKKGDFPKAADLVNRFPSLLKDTCEPLYEKEPKLALNVLNKLLIFLPSNPHIESSIDSVRSNIAQSFVSSGNIEGIEIAQGISSTDKRNKTLEIICKILIDYKNFDLAKQVMSLYSIEFNHEPSVIYLAEALNEGEKISDAIALCKKLSTEVAKEGIERLYNYWIRKNSSYALMIANEIENETVRGEKFITIAGMMTLNQEKLNTVDEKILYRFVDYLLNHKHYSLLLSLNRVFISTIFHQKFCERVFVDTQNKISTFKPTFETLDLLCEVSSDYEFSLHIEMTSFEFELYKQWLSKGRNVKISHIKFCWLIKMINAEQSAFSKKVKFLENIASLSFFSSLQQLTDSQYRTLRTLIDDSFLIENPSLACKLLKFGYHKEKIELFKKHLKTIATLDLQILFDLVSNNPEIKGLFLPLFEEHSNYSKKVIDWFHSQSSEDVLKAAYLLCQLIESEDLLIKHLKNRVRQILMAFNDLDHSSPNAKKIMQQINSHFFIFLDQDNTRIEELSDESIGNLFLYKSKQIVDKLKVSTLDKIISRCNPSEKLLWEEDITGAVKVNPEVIFIILKYFHNRSTFAWKYFGIGKNRNSILISLLKKVISTEEYQMLVLKVLNYLYNPRFGELGLNKNLNIKEIFSFYLLLLQDERCNLKINSNTVNLAFMNKNADKKTDSKEVMTLDEDSTILSLVNQGITHWLKGDEKLEFNKILIPEDALQRGFSIKSTIEYLKFLIEIKNEQDSLTQMVNECLKNFPEDEISPDLINAIRSSCKDEMIAKKAIQNLSINQMQEVIPSKDDLTPKPIKAIEDSCKEQLENQDQQKQDQIVKDLKVSQAKDEAKTTELSLDDDLFYDSDEIEDADEMDTENLSESETKEVIPPTISKEVSATQLSQLIEESLKEFSKEELTPELIKAIEDSCRAQLEDQDQ